MLTTSNPFGEVGKGHLKLEGMILRDPYQALQKIKDEAYFRSRMSLDVGTREPLEVILIQVQRRAGLLLEIFQIPDRERAVYKHIGICFSERDVLRLIFKDGDWQKAVVEII